MEKYDDTVFVLVTDKSYFYKADVTINDLKTIGNWHGGIVLIIIYFVVGLRPASSRCCSILATTGGVRVFVPFSSCWYVSLATTGGVSAFANSIFTSRKHVLDTPCDEGSRSSCSFDEADPGDSVSRK